MVVDTASSIEDAGMIFEFQFRLSLFTYQWEGRSVAYSGCPNGGFEFFKNTTVYILCHPMPYTVTMEISQTWEGGVMARCIENFSFWSVIEEVLRGS